MLKSKSMFNRLTISDLSIHSSTRLLCATLCFSVLELMNPRSYIQPEFE